MSVRVRRLEEKDKAAWLALFKGYIEFYKATVADEVIESTWQRLMAGQADFHIALVAVDDGGHADRAGARAVPPLDLVADPVLLSGRPVRRSRRSA